MSSIQIQNEVTLQLVLVTIRSIPYDMSSSVTRERARGLIRCTLHDFKYVDCHKKCTGHEINSQSEIVHIYLSTTQSFMQCHPWYIFIIALII